MSEDGRPLDVARRISAWGRTRFDAAFTVQELAAPKTGRSSETYLIDATLGAGDRARPVRWVVRIEARGHQVYEDPSVERQYRIIQQLQGQLGGPPTPKAICYEPDSAILGAPFFLMERVDGEAPPDAYHMDGVLAQASPAARQTMWLSGVEALARLHRLPTEPFAFLGQRQFGDCGLDQELGRWDRYRRWAGTSPSPILDRARAWLQTHKPRRAGVGFAWGDARLSNILFHEDRCVGVLDWETASLGGAETDLGWWLAYDHMVSAFAGAPRLEGLGGRDDTIAARESFAGRKAEAMEWHEVFATYRFALVLERAMALAASGPDARRDNFALRRLEEMSP